MDKHSKVGKDKRTVRKLDELTIANALRKGAAWTSCEDLDVIRSWTHGLSIGSIALIHGRTSGSILSRLRKLGMLDEYGYMNGQIWPDFTVQNCGSQKAIHNMIALGLDEPSKVGKDFGLFVVVKPDQQWPQADTYNGYVPASTVGLVEYRTKTTPLVYYYPQALSLSAQGVYMREGKMHHYGYVATFNVKDMARQEAEAAKNTDLENAKKLAYGSNDASEGMYTIKTPFEGSVWPGADFVADTFSVYDHTKKGGLFVHPNGVKVVDPEGNDRVNLNFSTPFKYEFKSHCGYRFILETDKKDFTGIPIEALELQGYSLSAGEATLTLVRGDITVEVQAAVVHVHGAVWTLVLTGVNAIHKAIKSSQCVDKHADPKIKLEQEMQEQIQKAINLLETNVVYPVVRFLSADGLPYGKQYTYKHRGEIDKGDYAVVITPTGRPALVMVEDFGHVTDLEAGIRYKWIAQVFDQSNYDALVAREEEARSNLRKSMTEKKRQEALSALLGDLGDTKEVRKAKAMLSDKPHDEVIEEHIKELMEEARARINKLVEENPDLATAMEGLSKAFGHIPGMPPLFPDAEERN